MLDLRDIHKALGRRKVLNGLSLLLEPGEIYGLLGPNGAGKSTTLRIVTGLVRPDRGRVHVDGCDLRQDRTRALRHVGAQIDGPAFHGHLSGRRNLHLLALLQELPPNHADRALEDVGLASRGKDRVQTYSTGMRQRLGIAATMLGRPRLLILDEPTAGLDPEGRQSILDLVRRLAMDYGPTVLFTSHIFDEVARLCDRVGILHDGALVHEGAARAADELREIYFGSTGGSPWEA